jgi:hypothetical protein
MGFGIDLPSDKIIQSFDRDGVDEAVVCPHGSLYTVGRRSVSIFNEYTETRLSNAALTPRYQSPHWRHARHCMFPVKPKYIERVL